MTWAMGYIWSHGVVLFEQAGYEVIIVDNLVNSYISTLEGIEKILGRKPQFYETDLRDLKWLEKIFQEHSFDGVIHFAWLKAVWESCENSLHYFDNNIVWSIRLFECMEKYDVKNLIFSSSATVYNPENFEFGKWVTESGSTWETTNPYGTTKYIIERILRDLTKFSCFKVINLRYFNPVGAHESGYIWEFPDEYPNNLLPYVMKVACKNLEKLHVFGDDYNTVDGTWVRDYIDVCDLVDAHLQAYQSLQWDEKYLYENFNLGTGKWTSVLELVKIAEEMSWQDIPYNVQARRSGDIGEVFCDPSKANQQLWWKAKTPLEDSVRNSWNFMQKVWKR